MMMEFRSKISVTSVTASAAPRSIKPRFKLFREIEDDAPDIINEMNVDSVVIACRMSDNWKQIVMDVLRPTGVKVSYFVFREEEVI